MTINITIGYFIALLFIFVLFIHLASSGTLFLITGRKRIARTLFIQTISSCILFATVFLSAIGNPASKICFIILIAFVVLTIPLLPKLSLQIIRLTPSERKPRHRYEPNNASTDKVAAQTRKKYIAILLFGEYSSYDFYDKHLEETHTSDEWLGLANDYNDEELGYVSAERFEFETLVEREAFVNGIFAMNKYISNDHSHACVLDERISDSM